MDTSPCTPCCTTPQSVNVPGSQGNSAVTVTTANFTIRAIGAGVNVSVGDSSWIKAGKNLFISDGANAGNFVVTGVNSATSIACEFIGFSLDSTPATVIASGALVIPGLGN